jgi:hypothetical protein
MHGGQAQPGALATRLGREERLEHPADHLRRHAVTGVADVQPGEPAQPAARRAGQVRIIDLGVRGLDRQPATVRHRVPGVDHQVDQHLLELAVVGQHPAEPGVQVQDQLGPPAQGAAEQVGEPVDHFVQVEHLRLRLLGPRVGEQLPGQRRGPVGGVLQLVEILADLAPLGRASFAGHLLVHERGVAGDDREQVVEVMGYPARQLAQAFQPLRLADLAFQLGPVGQELEPGPLLLGGQPLGAITDHGQHAELAVPLLVRARGDR